MSWPLEGKLKNIRLKGLSMETFRNRLLWPYVSTLRTETHGRRYIAGSNLIELLLKHKYCLTHSKQQWAGYQSQTTHGHGCWLVTFFWKSIICVMIGLFVCLSSFVKSGQVLYQSEKTPFNKKRKAFWSQAFIISAQLNCSQQFRKLFSIKYFL